jgi:hypothetical protein
MTPAYIKCVKGKFEAMRNSGELVPALINPTRGAIRDECLRLYPTRSGQKDKETVGDFFEHSESDGTLLDTIDRVDLEDLKALQNFLSGGTRKPNYRVVEMMAWLVDFQPRPYDPNVDYSTIAPELPSSKPLPNPKYPGEPKKPDRDRRVIIVTLLILISGVVGFTMLSNKRRSPQANGAGECMYWAGDHYEMGACIQRGGDSVLAAPDPVRHRNFKRITDTSLITRNSIGNVWYRIKEGEYEFYTMDGKHPLDGKNLRRLTENSYGDFLKRRSN